MEGKKFLSPRGMVLCGAAAAGGGGAVPGAVPCCPRGRWPWWSKTARRWPAGSSPSWRGPETLSLTGENGVEVTITFTPQGAAVTDSTCPGPGVRANRAAHPGGGVRHLPARPGHPPAGGGGDSVDATVY